MKLIWHVDHENSTHARTHTHTHSNNAQLTLSDRARYYYQAASRASFPDRVLVLRDSHKVV
jgi:hypothetical protein